MDRLLFLEEDVPSVNLFRLAYPFSVVNENDNFMAGALGLGCDDRVSCAKAILIFLFFLKLFLSATSFQIHVYLLRLSSFTKRVVRRRSLMFSQTSMTIYSSST